MLGKKKTAGYKEIRTITYYITDTDGNLNYKDLKLSPLCKT